MKPDWKDAPEWASWLAMDERGEWFWYETQPSRSSARAEWVRKGGNMIPAGGSAPWDETLEQRPEAKP
jgi:hypothetical protein